MITIEIDETQPAGRKILQQVAEHPEIGSYKNSSIPRDEHGNVVSRPLSDLKDHINKAFKRTYNVDYDVL
jgi:hypothetical protein